MRRLPFDFKVYLIANRKDLRNFRRRWGHWTSSVRRYVAGAMLTISGVNCYIAYMLWGDRGVENRKKFANFIGVPPRNAPAPAAPAK